MRALLGTVAASTAAGLAAGLTLGGGGEGPLLIGLATPPLAAVAAVAAWRAVVGTWFVGRLAGAALRSGGDDERFRDETRRSFEAIREAGPGALPGAWAVLPAAAGVGVLGGLAMAVTGGWLAGAALVAVVIVEAWALRRLARSGALLLPD